MALALVAGELRLRRGVLREALRDGQGAERLWLEVLGSALRADAVVGGQPVGCALAAELLRVRGKDGRIQPLVANAAQAEFERRRGRQNIVLKARQMGISTWVAGRMLLRTLLIPGTMSVQVAHTQAAAEQIFRMVHRFHSHLPAALRRGVWRCSVANRRQLVFPALDSEYRVESAGDLNAGRGMTVQNLHLSEVARWGAGAAEVLAGLRASLAPEGELVLESTPSGAHGCFYDEWVRGAPRMVRHFLPWWLEPSYVDAAVDAAEWTGEERELAARAGLDGRQIGFRRGLREQFGRLAVQEFAETAESCFLASGLSCFDAEAIASRMGEISAPALVTRNGKMWEWLGPQPKRQYVVALDPAGGGADGDFCALQVVDREQGLQCAEWQAHADPKEAAEVAAETARRYNNATLVVERNNHGHAVLARLEGETGFKLYSQDGKAGWLTNVVSRPRAVEGLERLLTAAPEMFMSARLLAELRSFVRRGDGSSGAAAGCHDDLVMAMAMAQAVRVGF